MQNMTTYLPKSVNPEQNVHANISLMSMYVNEFAL